MTVPTGTTLKAPVEVALAELRQHPGNPRKISEVRLEHLQRTLSAERDMLGARPLIALPDGTVIAGNQRLAAAVALGWETIPVVYADLDEEQAARWMLLDNRGFGEDDVEMLAALLRDLDSRDVDLDLAGYLSADVDAILRAAQPVSPRDPDEAPALPAKAKSVRGEVYELGPHRVMCGDATDEGDVSALVGTHGPCEAMWTDPPYGVSYVGKTADALTLQNDDSGGLPALLHGAFLAADSALAPSARLYIAAPAGPRGTTFRLAVDAVGWRLHEVLVWVKDTMVLGHSDYHYQHEDVLYGWKDGDGRPGRGKHEGTRWYGGNAQTSVFAIDRPKRSSEHPTMKPVELIVRQLANSSTYGDAILDPFAGSGTTLIACEMLDRRCFAMEIDPAYVDVIRQRYADYTGQPEYAP